MYQFIAVSDIDELVDVSNFSEEEQDQFLIDFVETVVANTYAEYLEDPEIPQELKDRVVHSLNEGHFSEEDHEAIFGTPYLRGLYEEEEYKLKVEYMKDFFEEVRQKADKVGEDVKQVLLDFVEYLETNMSLPENENEPEIDVIEVWKDFKALCVARLDMFKDEQI